MPLFTRRGEQDPFAQQRNKMLAQQLANRGISDSRVLAAMGRVRRERFVPEASQGKAYHDGALPIECGQTISQPYVVAAMSQALELVGSERVLEIGTGSGYQTAILAELAAEVMTIERHEALSHAARRLLTELGYDNVAFHVGDGTEGYAAAAPWDRILVTAAAPACPTELLAQLAEGGILCGPFGVGEGQQLVRYRKVQGEIISEPMFSVRFVPLISDDKSSDR